MFNFNYIKAQTNTLPPSGNVGIGTMTPAAKLEVVGNSMLRGSVTIDSNVLVRDSATFQKKLTVNQDLKIKGTAVFVDNANFKSELKVLGVAKMKNKLVVDSLVVMNSDAKIMGSLKLPNLSTTTNPTMFLTTNANGKVTSVDKSGLLNALYTSPSTCLSTGVNVGLPIWSALANANFGVLYTGIDCPARVGIGTNNPVSALQVVGTGFFQGNLGVNIAPTTTEVLKISNPINRTGIEITNNHPTVFALKYGIKNIVNNPNTIAYSVTDQATNQDVFVVKGDGSVGIGTDKTTGYKLSVEGDVRTRSIQVDATAITWSDFVFDKNYKLLNLSELENYIANNNHLPDVPSEKEVKEKGINLGEMDAILLQKIEELTLYIIQQEKRIKELEQQVKK